MRYAHDVDLKEPGRSFEAKDDERKRPPTEPASFN